MSTHHALPAGYLMEHPLEGQRLERKTRRGSARRQLLTAGLSEGMQALDLGCGTGAVTREMAAIVGPGRALGVDQSRERIAEAVRMAAERDLEIAFACHDAHALELPTATFDFAWSRFLFEYLEQPQRVLAEMVRVTKPGGIVAVADLDGQLQSFHPLSSADEACLAGTLRALRTSGFDPDVGRKLYGWFRSAGLTAIRVGIYTHQLYVGGIPSSERPNWQQKLETALPRVAYAGEGLGDAAAQLGALIERDDFFYYSTLICVSGRVPERSGRT